DLRRPPPFRPGLLVDVVAAHVLTILPHQIFAGHRMRDERESSGVLRRRNHDLARAEVRGRLASAVALPTVMARGTAIQCPRDHSQARRNARNAQLVAVLLHQNFIASWLGWRLKDAVRRAREILLRPEHPAVGFDFVVVSGKIVVSDGPIISQPVVRLTPETARSKA